MDDDGPGMFNEPIEAVRVTALVPDARRPTRVRVRAGRKTIGTVHVDDVMSLGLAVGDELDAEAMAKLERAAARDAARTQAINLIAARPYSRRRLLDRLRKKHEMADAEAAVEHVAGLGLLDDRAYAEAYLRAQAGGSGVNGTGPRLLEAKLRQRGVDGDVARSAVREAVEERDLAEDARAIAEKRAARPSMQALDRDAARRRLHGFMARRGFDSQVCRDAVDHALPR